MKALYGVISDTHCHNWTTFGSTDANGVNTRLKIILSEITRAAEEVQAAGGTHLFMPEIFSTFEEALLRLC